MRRVATSTQLIASHLRASEGVRVRQRIVFLLLLFNVKSYQEVRCCDSTEGSGRTMALCLSLGLVTWAPRGWRSPCSCCCCWPLCCLGQVGPGTLVSLLSNKAVLSAFLPPPRFCRLCASVFLLGHSENVFLTENQRLLLLTLSKSKKLLL